MGQYGNQPDFGTKAITVAPTGSAADPGSGVKLEPGMVYVGTSGDLIVTIVGGNEGGVNGTTFFKAVPVGILPIIVTNVWSTDGSEGVTTADDIVVLY